MITLGRPGLLGSCSDLLSTALKAHLKAAGGQVLIGPEASTPLPETATAPIMATTNEIALILKKTPPSKLRAIRHFAASSVNEVDKKRERVSVAARNPNREMRRRARAFESRML